MHHRIAATGRRLTILATTDAGPACTAPCCYTTQTCAAIRTRLGVARRPIQAERCPQPTPFQPLAGSLLLLSMHLSDATAASARLAAL